MEASAGMANSITDLNLDYAFHPNYLNLSYLTISALNGYSNNYWLRLAECKFTPLCYDSYLQSILVTLMHYFVFLYFLNNQQNALKCTV